MNPVKIKPQFVKEFWPRFQRGSIILIIALQLVSIGFLATFLYVSGFYETNTLEFWVLILAFSAFSTAAAFVVFKFVARPLQLLLSALTHIAGEPTTIKPPNPNSKNIEKHGLKPVLQTIYQMSSSAAPARPTDIHSDSELGQATRFIPSAETQSTIAAAIDQATSGFVVFNPDRRIIFASKATPIKVDTNGTQALDLLFQDKDSLFEWWDECDKNSVRAERTWPRVPNKLPNEEHRRFFDIIATYNKGTASEMVVTLVDRTKLYELGEADLDFIAFAAHELRGPITVIRGYIDVLTDELSDVLQNDQQELFRRLKVSANRLSGYINNILNTSRYDRRHLRMHLTESTMAEVYDGIRDDMDLRALSQNRSLVVEIPTDIPSIAADVSSLGEVFSNLIDNAIKYSNEGGIITVHAEAKGDRVELSVIDRGIGMPSNVVSNLFQKFYRSHRSRETVAGTGIGLYISKAIVESHGGTISVHSEDGHGSTFTISLPAYATVADKLKEANNGNESIITASGSWIKNHNMYRG